MDKLIICETDRGRYAVRPMSWEGIWNEKGKIQESLNHLALFIEEEDAEKFVEWKEAEEQGKLLKLPCAVGDTVYRVHKETKLSPDRVYECKVVGVKQEYNTFSVKLHANINEETYSIWIDDWFDKCQIGHEFFLTEEEAEAASKEL